MVKKIKSGEIWLDQDGKRIQAHGGSIIQVEDRYFWYGENKELTTADSDYWHNGMNCYSSVDLMNWTFEGKILEPSEDPKSPLHHSKKCDRPHILYNAQNKEFVMWLKVMGDEALNGEEDSLEENNCQFMCVLKSSTITGKFEFLRKVYPCGMYSGDFDLYQDQRDGLAYILFERPHTEIIIADLTVDYYDITGNYSAHFAHDGAPLAREAPCLFKKEDDFFLLTSGTAGYFPNPSEVATAKLIHGPWQVLGNPCSGDEFNDSFNCQFSSVFKVPGKQLYIALGDRWMAGTSFDNASAGKFNTSEATYVWLPIIFEEGVPRIEWNESWSIVDYADDEPVDLMVQLREEMQGAATSFMRRQQASKVKN